MSFPEIASKNKYFNLYSTFKKALKAFNGNVTHLIINPHEAATWFYFN